MWLSFLRPTKNVSRPYRPLRLSLSSAPVRGLVALLTPFLRRPVRWSLSPKWSDAHGKTRRKSTDLSTLGCVKQLAPWFLWVCFHILNIFEAFFFSNTFEWWIFTLSVGPLTGECGSLWWDCPLRGKVFASEGGAEVSDLFLAWPVYCVLDLAKKKSLSRS